MQIEKKKILDLLPAGYNPRKDLQPGDKEYENLKKSIQEFDYIDPVIWNEQTGVVVGGHQRLKVLQDLGHTDVEVSVVDLPLEREMALNVALNKVSGDWDTSKLSDLMLDLQDMDIDMELTGFDMDEINDLLPDKVEDGLCDEDQVPDVPEEPITKLGDIYQLGDHRLMCGDSTSIDAVDRLMDDDRADMVFTDPPYGVSYQSNMRTKTKKFDVIENDDVFLDVAPIIEACSTGWVFIWTSWKVITKWIDLFDGFGYPTNQVIWFKGGGGIGDLKKTFLSDYETALVWNRGAELTGKRIGSVWKVDKDGAASYTHPTQKPVALAEEAIDKTTRIKDKILDLFGGSGSTLIACEKTGRKARLMELDPKYCDVIVKRWEDYTGKKAELLNG